MNSLVEKTNDNSVYWKRTEQVKNQYKYLSFGIGARLDENRKGLDL